jgi:hypothetical protein
MISAMDLPTMSGEGFGHELIVHVFAAARQHEWSVVQHGFQFFFLDAHTISVAGAQHEKRAEQAGAEYSPRQDDPTLPALLLGEITGGGRRLYNVVARAKIQNGLIGWLDRHKAINEPLAGVVIGQPQSKDRRERRQRGLRKGAHAQHDEKDAGPIRAVGDGADQQNTRLSVGILHKPDRRCRNDIVAFDSCVNGGPPRRVGCKIKSRGGLVAGKRLDIGNWIERRPVAGRLHLPPRAELADAKARHLLALRRLKRGPLPRSNPRRPFDCLDRRKVLQQDLDKTVKSSAVTSG